MKLFKSQKKSKKGITVVNKTSLRNSTKGRNYLNHSRESQILLKNINERKRRVINSRLVLRKKHGVFLKILFLLIFLGALGYLFFKFDVPGYFKITNVSITGTERFVSTEDVKNIVDRNAFGKYIFSVEEQELSEVISKSFLGAKNVFVKKDYPNSLNIFIEERVPVAFVFNNKDEFYLIDADGYVLGMVTDGLQELPRINYEGSVVVGTFLDKDIIPISIEILKFADREDLKISSMSFTPNYAKLYLNIGPEVFMGYVKDIEKSLRTIKALVSSSKNNEEVIKKIDLRYDKVIVLYD